jgi:hypothetical protein
MSETQCMESPDSSAALFLLSQDKSSVTAQTATHLTMAQQEEIRGCHSLANVVLVRIQSGVKTWY